MTRPCRTLLVRAVVLTAMGGAAALAAVRPPARAATDPPAPPPAMGPATRAALQSASRPAGAPATTRPATQLATRPATQPTTQPGTPCPADRLPPALVHQGEEWSLNIPARDQSPARPKEGWCGETAIQEACLFNGAYFPQEEINRAGAGDHPDLYAQDLPTALRALGMRFESWSNDPPGLTAYLAWLRKQVQAGRCVLGGIKINPTQHPEWGLDHFVNVIGFDKESFTFNTTWGRRIRRTLEQLDSTQKGFGLRNVQGRYFGMSVLGPRTLPQVPVRLAVVQEDRERMTAIVTCENLTPGTRYVLRKGPSYEERGTVLTEFTATAARQGFYDVIAKSRSAVYQCHKK